MGDFCVVVAEGARARFFTLEANEVPELEGGPDLVEHTSLANPAHRAHDDKILSDPRSHGNRMTTGGGHSYDDHREAYDAEIEQRFARDIATELDRLCASQRGTPKIILCAEKRMLGHLRTAMNGHAYATNLVEVPKDLAKLKAKALHEKLSADGLMPARRHGGL